jgi:polyisoprenoid-binding protein YceI
MKMIRVRRQLLFSFLVLCAASALAQQTVFQLDPAQSTVEFTLGDVLHTVHGKFKMKDSTVHFDPASGLASGALVVDATSGSSGNSSRDRKMNKDILECAKYPEFRFILQSIKGSIPSSGSSQVEMTGVMNLHGGDHLFTVTSPVQVSNGHVTAEVHFVVPYVEWGLKDPSNFILRVNKKVDITVHAVGTLTPVGSK